MKMRNYINTFFIIAFMLVSFYSMALEVDQKLTIRILKITKTKKTILVNRGQEDGLAVGDHAKFFQTSGVIARGVVAKVSPSRSIWSLYRVVDATDLVQDRVLKLKISTPVKVTEDESKSLIRDSMDTGEVPVQIPLAPGADDMPKDLSESEKKDLSSLGGDVPVGTTFLGMLTNKTWELWGLMNFSALSSKVNQGEGDTTGKATFFDFSLGLEKYFSDPQAWYHDLSVLVLIHSGSRESISLDADKLNNDVFEYGLGLHYHFLADPLMANKLILYGGVTAGLGKVKDSIDINRSTTLVYSNEYTGSSTFVSVGAGAKYFIPYGIGARALIDYYQRRETYDVADSDSSYTRTVSGPRLQLGLSYRW